MPILYFLHLSANTIPPPLSEMSENRNSQKRHFTYFSVSLCCFFFAFHRGVQAVMLSDNLSTQFFPSSQLKCIILQCPSFFLHHNFPLSAGSVPSTHKHTGLSLILKQNRNTLNFILPPITFLPVCFSLPQNSLKSRV